MMMRSFAVVPLLFALSAFGQQGLVAVPNEPSNLDTIKQQLTRYHACSDFDCYLPQIDRQIDIALIDLEESVAHARHEEKLALVLDIDETSLSNWTVETKDDFGYMAADSNKCIADHCGTAIAGTLRLYQQAIKDHVTVFFITGRPESQRADTEANLKAVGYDTWSHVYLRAADPPTGQSVADYKSSERADIASKGYHIVLNVGDQFSDLAGSPEADHSVKLPNPFYFIP